jgi:hypothetical protein
MISVTLARNKSALHRQLGTFGPVPFSVSSLTSGRPGILVKIETLVT